MPLPRKAIRGRIGDDRVVSVEPRPSSGIVVSQSRDARGRRTLELAPGEIHLWLEFHEHSIDERQLAVCRNLLSRAERDRELCLARASDRFQYVLTRALVRATLSRYAPVDPRDWEFASNPYGRPEIAPRELCQAHLGFNVSHTPGLIALGVSRCAQLGVDAEDIHAREAPMNVATRFFAPEESATLVAAPPEERQYRFFEYWTLKEAYLKARGKGLSLPLDQLRFSFPDDRTVMFSASPELESEPRQWRFWQLHSARRWLVSVCARRAAGRRSSLSVRLAATGEIVAPAIAPRGQGR